MDRLIAINLLIQLGVAAAVASALVRSRTFKNLLFADRRTISQTLYLVLWIGMPFALGVVVRATTPNFLAADLSFESSVLTGVIGGPIAGVLGGVFVSLPSAVHGEWLNLPFCVFAGVVAGKMRDLTKDREDIWSFSPGIDLSIYRWIRRNLPRPKVDWQIALCFLKLELHRWEPDRIFRLYSGNLGILVLMFAASVMCTAIPMKIWNNTRIE